MRIPPFPFPPFFPCAPVEARRWIFCWFLGGKFGGNLQDFWTRKIKAQKIGEKFGAFSWKDSSLKELKFFVPKFPLHTCRRNPFQPAWLHLRSPQMTSIMQLLLTHWHMVAIPIPLVPKWLGYYPPRPPRKHYENNSPRLFLCNFGGWLRQNYVIIRKLIPDNYLWLFHTELRHI